NYAVGPCRMSDCIRYKGCIRPDGRGWRRYQGKPMDAARAAWMEKNGPIPKGIEVRHNEGCDKACVNLDHMCLGTHWDNMQDEVVRKTRVGSRNGAAKLTEEQVVFAMARMLTGE